MLTYTHQFYTELYLKSLLKANRRRDERLVRRYIKWNRKFIKLSKSEKYSYDRLKGFRERMNYLRQDIVECFAGSYPLYGLTEIELPASKERWELEERGRLAAIRHQRWQEMMQDNIRCKKDMLATGKALDEEFCPYCNRYLTPEEQDACRCACCGGVWYIEDGMWDEPIDY